MTHEQYEVLSNQAVAACAVVYFLAFLAHLAQWAAGRKVETPVAETVAVGAGTAPGSRRATEPRPRWRSPSGCTGSAGSASR